MVAVRHMLPMQTSQKGAREEERRGEERTGSLTSVNREGPVVAVPADELGRTGRAAGELHLGRAVLLLLLPHGECGVLHRRAQGNLLQLVLWATRGRW